MPGRAIDALVAGRIESLSMQKGEAVRWTAPGKCLPAPPPVRGADGTRDHKVSIMNRKLAGLLLLVMVMLAPVVGCGVATTEPENRRIIMRTANYDALQLVDDLGLLTQTNRPFRGSKYVID